MIVVIIIIIILVIITSGFGARALVLSCGPRVTAWTRQTGRSAGGPSLVCNSGERANTHEAPAYFAPATDLRLPFRLGLLLCSQAVDSLNYSCHLIELGRRRPLPRPRKFIGAGPAKLLSLVADRAR